MFQQIIPCDPYAKWSTMLSNETHESTTDADARLYRKGKTGSELRFMGHTLTDNRHGLIDNAVVTTADGHARARGGQGNDP